MRELTNLSDDPVQRHVIPIDESDSDVIIVLRFYSTIAAWFIDIDWAGRSVKGVKLSLGVGHIESTNLPFDFAVADFSGNGLDPFKLDDFSAARCGLAILNADEMTAIRGVEVATS